MLRVGLTGGIGSGKSTVAELFRELGARVIDADALAREVTLDPAVLEEIGEAFGPGVITDGRLDRTALAATVFGDAGKLARLNAIIHPRVRERSAELREAFAGAGTHVLIEDIPLLYESGLADRFDYVVVVTAPLAERIRRVQERSGLSAEETRKRDAAQLPLSEKAARADFVISNSGSLEELGAQVKETWRKLTGASARQ